MRFTLLPLIIASLSVQAIAEEHSHTAHRSHGTHQHGVGTLNLGLDEQSLLIELELPAMNVVGFEHQPKTDEQQQRIEQTSAKLKDGNLLFDLPKKAKCRLLQASVESELLSDDDEHHDEHEHHDKHEHHHEHEYEQHDEHKDHDDHEHKTEAHSEFAAHYEFLCRKPQQLDAITVKLFASLPGTERLDAQVISTTGQLGKKLTAKDNRLPLR